MKYTFKSEPDIRRIVDENTDAAFIVVSEARMDYAIVLWNTGFFAQRECDGILMPNGKIMDLFQRDNLADANIAVSLNECRVVWRATYGWDYKNSPCKKWNFAFVGKESIKDWVKFLGEQKDFRREYNVSVSVFG